MFEITADTSEVEARLRRALSKMPDELLSGVMSMGDIAKSEMQDTLSPHNYNSIGYSSIDVRPVEINAEFIEVEVGPLEELWVYLGVLNSGRPSGTMPNIDALAEWINRTGISFSNATDKQMAYALAMRIKDRGTVGSSTGYHWFDDAADRAMPKLEWMSEEFLEVFG